MSQHTPEPWEYENVSQAHDRSAYGVVKDADGKVLFDTLNSDVAVIHEEFDGEDGTVYRWDEAARTNLTLAAAAPDLLAACKEMLLRIKEYQDLDGLLTAKERASRDKMIAAVAKAEGGAS